MTTAFNAFESRRTIVAVRLGFAVLAHCRDAFCEWRIREKLRTRLDGLSERELLDFGIGRGEIDYVSSNRASDPRGAVLPS
ncbi:DUF1127 domain-containing protein [Bradyrhizobium sp. CCGUVB1N3]|uniref:DUF1127 domain-containing protein n=1 Tax=Bradyrhizobium sp. CCGUVB1N3 TaxID=2949629 RepID=UPI0020B21982|nr:DUF1127 domain-containing protein [Bradyrhizobium sp. CCGUVB1N3]MCP3469455.1 DUF1127 domain-containing protein [Bradyrhizobium sp. CCGUVB1N3]